jgi:hypothetical protein
MTWHDMIWYDMIWYDMIWYDMIWYDMIWYDIWHDMTWHDIWYDMINLLTAIGLPPGGSSTVHITHRQYIEQHNRHKQYVAQHSPLIRKSADRAPSVRGIPWHLLCNWKKSTEKLRSCTLKLLFFYVKEGDLKLVVFIYLLSRPTNAQHILTIFYIS